VVSFSKSKSKISSVLSLLSWDIGVDLGSSNVKVYLKDRGVVIDEPSIVARQKKKRWTGLSAPKRGFVGPIAFGYKAKEMINREPGQIEVVKPLKNGIINDMEAAEMLITYYMKLLYEIPSKGVKIFKPRVLVGVPSFISNVQKRAVRSIFLKSGAREVILIEEAVLAAIGLGLVTDNSSGLVIVDVGGGKTEVTVVSMGGIVLGKSVRVAGEDFDESILNYVKMKYGLLIGKNSAERVKIELANVAEELGEKEKSAVIRGRDLETGLPKSIKIKESEIREALSLDVAKIVRTVSEVLDETPPDMMEDILKRGIIMVGEGSLMRGLDELIEKKTRIITRVTDDPGMCVIRGCGELLQNRMLFNQIKLVSGLG
jgi:rod shape-determining protein MreB